MKRKSTEAFHNRQKTSRQFNLVSKDPGSATAAFISFTSLNSFSKFPIRTNNIIHKIKGKSTKSHYQRIIDGGHTLAMHSYSHDYPTLYASLSSFKEDFHKSISKVLCFAFVSCIKTTGLS